MQDPRSDITAILRAISAGDREAVERLVPLVYETLKRIAHHQLRRNEAALCTTELVHEAFLKIVPAATPDWQGRAHFFGVAARAMRQVLIDLARRRRVASRDESVRAVLGGGEVDVALEELIALGDALHRLGEVSERLRSVVEYRYFAGLSEAEIAEILQVSTRTVERDWVKARLWLHRELYPEARDVE